MKTAEKADFSVHRAPVPVLARERCGLAPIHYADAYAGRLNRTGVTAAQMAKAMFADPPRFASMLMSARNAVVRPLGLKAPDPHRAANHTGCVGIFPILSDTGQQMVLGLDDRHLDFRICVSVEPRDGGSDVVLSTLLRFNHLSGRIYLFCIKPFHHLLSRLMLRRALIALAAPDEKRKA